MMIEDAPRADDRRLYPGRVLLPVHGDLYHGRPESLTNTEPYGVQERKDAYQTLDSSALSNRSWWCVHSALVLLVRTIRPQ